MSTRVAINGLGRIGRAIVKLVIDEPSFELVAVNDLMDVENLGYLLRYDTVYGRFSKPVAVDQMLREAVSVSLPLGHQPAPANVIARDPATVARAET